MLCAVRRGQAMLPQEAQEPVSRLQQTEQCKRESRLLCSASAFDKARAGW